MNIDISRYRYIRTFLVSLYDAVNITVSEIVCFFGLFCFCAVFFAQPTLNNVIFFEVHEYQERHERYCDDYFYDVFFVDFCVAEEKVHCAVFIYSWFVFVSFVFFSYIFFQVF